MAFDSNPFTIHDVQAFPYVVFRSEAATPGYALQWQAEMDALVACGLPFVVVHEQIQYEEDHEDRKIRALWLKHNKEALGRVCRALISVEPDEQQRENVRAFAATAQKAFGIRQEVVATPDEARAVARSLIVAAF
ncbi:hypothetical protein [Kerstersia similis]|uniref:hypothetical protein n=1 Tax=Kerstersia similis TaxID=206505 RepID=UPI0039F0FECB